MSVLILVINLFPAGMLSVLIFSVTGLTQRSFTREWQIIQLLLISLIPCQLIQSNRYNFRQTQLLLLASVSCSHKNKSYWIKHYLYSINSCNQKQNSEGMHNIISLFILINHASFLWYLYLWDYDHSCTSSTQWRKEEPIRAKTKWKN